MSNANRRTSAPSDWAIAQLPGLSAQQQAQLQALGIETTLQLLERGRTGDRRQQLANQLRVRVQQVNKWVAMCDLARIHSVGCQHCGLLLHAGIGSAAQLSQMSIQRLHQQILRLQVATLRRRDLCPSTAEIAQWIQQARSLHQT
jgi:hypothetical protein